MQYYTGKDTDTATRRERENRRVSTEFHVLVNFARSLGCLRNYSHSMKEMEYVSHEGYLQEELLTELIAPGFLIKQYMSY